MSDGQRLEPGDTLAGSYRIEEVVGQGGFSTVYRATQTALGRSVAIKWMKTRVDELNSDRSQALDDLVERFRREARIIARLTHPATVTLYDFGRTIGGDFYMVLEYVDGVQLSRLRGERLAPNRVVRLLEQALESLAEAHDHGVVHRDIKPDNLMVYDHRGRRNRLKILDFGIAKVLRALDEKTLRQITGESKLIGTPRYIAPENATNRDPGPPADIYSLGLIAYELLLAERAVTGDDQLDILDRHLSSDFQARIERRPGVPDGLRRVVNRMMEKKVADRYTGAGEVLEDLRALPDYAEGYGATDQLPRPPSARDTDQRADAPVEFASTDSFPNVSAYGDTPDLGGMALHDGADRLSSGPYHTKGGSDPEDRTAHERPQPPEAREKRASYPPGQTTDLPGPSDRDGDAETSDAADRTDGTGSRVALTAAIVVVAVVMIAVGIVVL